MNDSIVRVLIGPHLSEKASNISENQEQYTFKVLRSANKLEIKKAIEVMFQVKVAAVNTVSCVGKAKRSGRKSGRTKAWKKAYVQLQEGQKIEMASQEGVGE